MFRINVLFKNFEIKGPADKVLIYLLVLLSHLFKVTDNMYSSQYHRKDIAQINKKLTEVNGLNNPYPKDKGNFLSAILEEGLGNEREAYLQYVKQLKAETINRFAQRYCFEDKDSSKTICP